MTTQTQDPAEQWADLLRELTGRRRDAAVSALRHSAASGWPASRESVVSLIAYAQGRITARDYAAQTLISLGLADAHTAPLLLRAASAPAVQPPPTREESPPHLVHSIDPLVGAEYLSTDPLDERWRR